MENYIRQSVDFNNFLCSCGNQITKLGEYISGSLTSEQTGDRTILGKCTKCRIKTYTINLKRGDFGVDSIIVH